MIFDRNVSKVFWTSIVKEKWSLHGYRQNVMRLESENAAAGYRGRWQPRFHGILTSYADHEADATPPYTSINSAIKMGEIAATMDLQFVW